MSDNTVPKILPDDNAKRLQIQISIEAIKQEIETITNKIQDFEAVLKQHTTDYIIEFQELNTLYKQQKRAKKDKRLSQKQRGKHYKAPTGLQIETQKQPPNSSLNSETLQLKKRLYREAMLQVHPDKFSLSPHEQESATEITTQLIHIYKHEDLNALQLFHAQVFSNTIGLKSNTETIATPPISKMDALHITLKQLETELKTLKESELYNIISNHQNPIHFIDELIIHYKDKIAKFKKRTRTK